MRVKAWFHRHLDESRRNGSIKRKQRGTRRRGGAAERRPRPPRGEQYDSEFITRFGDPFD
jgi:hypothetical protein